MQDADRPAHIQALPEPARVCRPRIETQPLRVMLLTEGLDRIGRHRGRLRDVRQGPAVRSPEPKRAVGLSIDPVPLLVNRAVMPATQ